MKRFFALFLFSSLVLFPSITLAQGAHRISQVVVKGNGIAANISPGSKILVCVLNTGCKTSANIYLDSALTTPAFNPVTADGSGNYDYYVASGCVDEQISAPGQGSMFVPHVCPFNGQSGGGGALNPGAQTQVVFYPTSGTTGGPTNVQVDASTGNFLTAPNTNGAFNTDRYASGSGNNGVSNLVTSPNCTTAGCLIARPATSADSENIANALNGSVDYTHATDSTFGTNSHYFYNPGQNILGGSVLRDANPTTCYWNDALKVSNANLNCKSIYSMNSDAGIYVGSPWTLHKTSNIDQWTYGRSIAQVRGATFLCYKVGDCALDYSYLHYRGGAIATSDEAVEGEVKQLLEDDPPHGTIITGGANATIIKSNWLNPNNEGDGYNLVSTNEVMGNGLITGQAIGGGNLPNSITTSDSHAVSTGIATLNSACGTNVVRNAPVSTTCTITVTSGSFNALPNATVCIADWHYPEQVNITATGANTVTLGLAYAHPPGTRIEQGGLCGGKLAMWGGLTPLQTPHFQFTTYFIAGSPTATTVDYVIAFVGGQDGAIAIKVPTNGPYPIAGTITRASNVVSINGIVDSYALNKYVAPPQAAITVAGAIPSDLNGTVTGTLVSPNAMTWNQTGANETGSGGTISVTGLNNYTIYCGAETVKVFTTLNGTGFPSPAFDGSLQVEPNNCSWPTGGGIAQPNHYSQSVVAHRTVLDGFTAPTGQGNQDRYTQFSGQAWSGAAENTVRDFDTLASWLGQGGTLVPHMYLNSINTAYTTMLKFTYPPFNGGQVMSFGCPAEGCVSTAYPYTLFANPGVNGESSFVYNPGNSTYGMINAGLQNNLFINSQNAIGVSHYGTVPGVAGVGGWFVSCTLSNDTLCIGNGNTGDSTGSLGAKSLEGANLVAGAATPATFTVFAMGTQGSTTYTYSCTAVTANGETPAGTGTTNNGNATLSFTNYNIPSCIGSPGAQSLNIYRTVGGATQGKIANVPAGNSSFPLTTIFKDTGFVGDGTTPPVTNTSGKLTVFGQATETSLILGGSQSLTGVQGTTGTRILSTTGSFTPGHVITTDSNGNAVDGGVAPGTTGFTGACAPTTTLTVVNGIITGCS